MFECERHEPADVRDHISVMTGQRRVDPFAVKGLLDRGRIKQAKVGRQNQEYQRQG